MAEENAIVKHLAEASERINLCLRSGGSHPERGSLVQMGYEATRDLVAVLLLRISELEEQTTPPANVIQHDALCEHGACASTCPVLAASRAGASLVRADEHTFEVKPPAERARNA